MRLQEVGGAKNDDLVYLRHDWYRHLTDAQLAAYVRYLFIYHKEGVADWENPAHTKRRPLWDGGTDRFGVKHKSVWGKIVKLLRATKAYPGLWVAAHFSPAVFAVRTAQGKGVIENRPELLSSATSPEIYQNTHNDFEEMFLDRFEAAEISITTRFKITEAFELPPDDHFLLTICDTSHVNATPFLRHAFSNGMHCQRGMRKYIWPAALEYESRQPLYDKLIQEKPEFEWLITADQRELVTSIRKHWSTYDE